jgi:hypothetical protein
VPVDHREGVGCRVRLTTMPPNPPRTSIATPPPSSARIEPLLPEEACELDALSTAEGSVDCRSSTLAPCGPAAPPRPAVLAVPEPEPEPDDPPEPGGFMPAPKGGPEELLLEEASAPVCLA